ncbi:hypothetical protein A2348_00370 [Candidatus Uhrbacteria bacterium RIFOXYB12_FULL_58_10]|uniref:Uncharacterized protein n=1 Tax=Candidatus Uhrbacteria bacterium RIFOXYB2_FULL_57_15 TaxID=1802422 RepID=A0A1F7W8E4_9BACT|nr:MAG: hypothetical protein A2348_00370 [Candidatus Uhrbacteria bacterium RIFOXYB12_FULL_58_10]OGL98364.1 MAG: hypothetical protein A2304_01560 [Candidatus Uhrbacteria bacterium RIFOXYB2_FULL_57_15]
MSERKSGDAREFSVDEMRKLQGLPPETPEERAKREAKDEERDRVAADRAKQARELAETQRREKQDAKARLDRSVELALDAGDVTAFQREAVNIVRVFDNLSATRRNLLWKKMETMQMETLAGTPEEITAMNVLGEKIRRWKSEEKGRFEARARVFQISIDRTHVEEGFGLLDKKPENPDASNRRPRTFGENLFAIFGFWKK